MFMNVLTNAYNEVDKKNNILEIIYSRNNMYIKLFTVSNLQDLFTIYKQTTLFTSY